MATKAQVLALHAANPSWTARDIADDLGCLSAYVRATAQQNGLRLPHHRRGPGEAACRLRRAAPDLLAAGKGLMDAVAVFQNLPWSLQDAMTTMVEAIAKATGESAQ